MASQKPKPKPPLTRLRRLRENAGMTQAKLAYLAGVSLYTLWILEHCTDRDELDRTKLGTLRKVAHALGVSVAELAPELSQ